MQSDKNDIKGCHKNMTTQCVLAVAVSLKPLFGCCCEIAST